jgi:outer membrane protein OmpA-like peptidoglycan-associated protein
MDFTTEETSMKIQDHPPIYFKVDSRTKTLQTDDEYYWKNQQQLEDSALSFQDFIKGDKKELESSPAQKNWSNHANSDSSLALRSVKKEVSNPFEFATQLMTTETFATDVYRPVHQQLLDNPAFDFQPAVKERAPSLISTNRSLQKQIGLTEENSRLKNYQLFILNNQAEFSLNTSQLDSQQTRELTQLIKQWLVKKGIRLQQLIINGVKQ